MKAGPRWALRAILPGVAALAAAGCGGSSKPPPFEVVSAAGDVEVTSCALSTSGLPGAEIKVTNHSSATADYVTVISFSSGGKTTNGVPGFERGVPSGKSVAATVTATTSFPAGSALSCKVVSVKRNPSTVITPTTS